MKLIVKEYLAALKERQELDAILPDLLSQLGLTVFSKPSIGTRQYGVDVAAVGNLGDGEKVYLFSVKSRDLTHHDWDNGPQSLRASINDIVDTYIPTHLPSKYKNKPIVICLCFGGDIKEDIRLSVSQVTKGIEEKHSNIVFDEWNGDKLAGFISEHFLHPNLMLKEAQSHLRKTLALLDDVDISYQHYTNLLNYFFSNANKGKDKDTLLAIRQLSISVWILFAWSRSENNYGAVIQGSERALLYAWEICKKYNERNTKEAKAILQTFNSVLLAYRTICREFLQKKIFPNIQKKYALSKAVASANSLDINLKLFDLLGLIAMEGFWLHWKINAIPDQSSESINKLKDQIRVCENSIKKMINNNPILFSPCKDEQAIDIFIAALFLLINKENNESVVTWLLELIRNCRFGYKTNGNYPVTLTKYQSLLEHTFSNNDDEQRTEKTTASILYPIIAILASQYNLEAVYNEIKSFKEEDLSYCDFQLWFPDEISEAHFYINDKRHGQVLLCNNLEKTVFKRLIKEECNRNTNYNELSCIKFGIPPLMLLACKHYRYPVPLNILFPEPTS